MLETTHTLRFNYEFSRVYKRGTFATGRYLSVHCFKRSPNLRHNMTKIPSDILRVGFTNAHGHKTAVARNRAKRLMRAAFTGYEASIRTGYDIIFLMKSGDVLPSFQEVRQEMGRHLKKLGLLESGEEA